MSFGYIKNQFGKTLADIESRLHQYPELSFQEYNTTKFIRDELRALGCEIIDLGMDTGVAARLNTGKTGPVIGLRADIDAIAQQEATGRQDASTIPGVMHACGHDVHTTALLGAAMVLSQKRDELKGDVVFVFQPAEENIQGAKAMIDHGLFEKAPMDMLFGLHNAPDLNSGTIGVKLGPLMAGKDEFRITVHGFGGHGGIPDKCIDPIVAASGIVNALQTIVSRNISPLDAAVVSVCSIHGGTADNLIVDAVELTGSVRSMTPSTRDTIMRRLSEIAINCAQAYGCTAYAGFYNSTPVLNNEKRSYEIALNAARETAGEAQIVEPAMRLASEDFAEYAGYTHTFFYFLGSGISGRQNALWHSAQFRACPDTAIWGASLYYNSVVQAQSLL